jgi:hypothetical protein
MIDLVIQSPNQNLLYRPNRKTYIVKSNTNTLGFYEKVLDRSAKTESFYLFPNLEPTNNVQTQVNNPLSMYDEQAHKMLIDVIEAVKKCCKEYDLSYKKNKYFLYSEVVENQDPRFWYDAGGNSKPSLFGIISIDNIVSNIEINENSLSLSPGDMVVSEAGNKIKYLQPFKSILFYVSPISTIKNQYSQKWIPLV